MAVVICAVDPDIYVFRSGFQSGMWQWGFDFIDYYLEVMKARDDFCKFRERVLHFARNASLKKAYQEAEAEHMQKNGRRKFKTYRSFASSQSYHCRGKKFKIPAAKI